MNKHVVHIYNAILLSHKKEWSNAICVAWMDLEVIILSEVSQTEKNNHIISLIWGIFYKKREAQTNIFTIQKHRKQTYGYQRRKLGWQANKLGDWD